MNEIFKFHSFSRSPTLTSGTARCIAPSKKHRVEIAVPSNLPSHSIHLFVQLFISFHRWHSKQNMPFDAIYWSKLNWIPEIIHWLITENIVNWIFYSHTHRHSAKYLCHTHINVSMHQKCKPICNCAICNFDSAFG